MAATRREGPGGGEWVVGPGEVGWRLDAFVAAALGTSRSRARTLLGRGAIRLEGRPVELGAKGTALREGQRVSAEGLPEPRQERPVPEPERSLQILAEGPGWLAVEKPPGVPVHPLAPEETGTVLNALVARRPGIFGVGEGGLRSGVVHRLDVETSGVLLFATEPGSWQRLRRGFRRHRVRKTYRALVHGHLEGAGELRLALQVARHRPARVRVVEPGAPDYGRTRPTRLGWRALIRLHSATLVEVRPVTGFLHQVRASLAWLGHPLLGDPTYGGERSPWAPRHLLHASHLAFGPVQAASPDPEDFRQALRRLG